MHNATLSSHSYDFRKDFSDIARPGLHRYLDAAGAPPDNGDWTNPRWYPAKQYVRQLWRHLTSVQRDERGRLDDLELYGIEGWTRESVAAYVEARLADILADFAPTPPVDVDRTARLGTELARKQNAAGDLPQIDVGPEAVAYATDRLKSKIERDLVCDPVAVFHSGLQSYSFLKGMKRGGNVVYVDWRNGPLLSAAGRAPMAGASGAEIREWFNQLPLVKRANEAAQIRREREQAEADAAPEIIEPIVPEDADGIQKKKRPSLPAFMAGCMINADGYPYQNTYNVLWALTRAKGLKGAFAFDEMTRSTTVKFGDSDARQIADTDITSVQVWLQKNALLASMSGGPVAQAIEKIAHENSFHPVRDYLGGLAWDRAPRLDKMLHRYFGASDTNYSSAVGAMFLIAMVARIMRPGCKADYMPIFEGPQGKGKSKLCAILAGEEWFSDQLPDLHSKDASSHLRGKWLIEVAELDKMNRAETNTLKAFITRQVEDYRPAYGKYETREPRQCVFTGTTNDASYLRDETGGRRFWPVACGTLDPAGLARDRDQLFAEAVVRFNGGEPWWPDAEFEASVIKPVQADRYQHDAWEDEIRAYVERVGDGFTVVDCALGALDLRKDRLGVSEQMRITKVLKVLGLKQKHTKRGNVWWAGEGLVKAW